MLRSHPARARSRPLTRRRGNRFTSAAFDTCPPRHGRRRGAPRRRLMSHSTRSPLPLAIPVMLGRILAEAWGAIVREVAILIPNWNGRPVLERCLRALLDQAGDVDLEVIVVDNASTDGAAELLLHETARSPRLRVILNDHNRLFAAACNQAYALTGAPFVVVANNDVEPSPGAVRALLRHALDAPNVAAVTPRFVLPDGSFQEAYRRLPNAAFVIAHYHPLGRLVDRLRAEADDCRTVTSAVISRSTDPPRSNSPAPRSRCCGASRSRRPGACSTSGSRCCSTTWISSSGYALRAGGATCCHRSTSCTMPEWRRARCRGRPTAPTSSTACSSTSQSTTVGRCGRSWLPGLTAGCGGEVADNRWLSGRIPATLKGICLSELGTRLVLPSSSVRRL